jgi:hypothetical protein
MHSAVARVSYKHICCCALYLSRSTKAAKGGRLFYHRYRLRHLFYRQTAYHMLGDEASQKLKHAGGVKRQWRRK